MSETRTAAPARVDGKARWARTVPYKKRGEPRDLDWLLRWTIPIPFCGCLVWMGSLSKGGYPTTTTEAGKENAMRVAYRFAKGAIPEGFDIDHLCRVRSCVNPDHLEAVTRQENLLRGDGPRLTRLRASLIATCPAGHAYDGDNLYVDSRGKRGCRECRREACRKYRARQK